MREQLLKAIRLLASQALSTMDQLDYEIEKQGGEIKFIVQPTDKPGAIVQWRIKHDGITYGAEIFIREPERNARDEEE